MMLRVGDRYALQCWKITVDYSVVPVAESDIRVKLA